VLLIGGGSGFGEALTAALDAAQITRTSRTGAGADAALRLEDITTHRPVLERLFAGNHDTPDGHSSPANHESTAVRAGFDLVIIAAGNLPEEDTPERLRRHAGTDLAGGRNVLRTVGALLEANGGGRIVLLSSMSSVRLRRTRRWYGATKRELERATRREGHRTGVHATVVRAGRVATPMTEGRPGIGPLQTAQAAAAGAARGIRRGRRTVYTSRLLVLTAIVLRLLPARVISVLEPVPGSPAR
jgi:NAD(P)-dependent dehydrogenase (short-subunit alcohol dehydrogenase family)